MDEVELLAPSAYPKSERAARMMLKDTRIVRNVAVGLQRVKPFALMYEVYEIKILVVVSDPSYDANAIPSTIYPKVTSMKTLSWRRSDGEGGADRT